MYNKAIIMGRIATDLDLKTTPSGVSVISFRVAVDRKYQSSDAEKKTDFINIVAWRNEAELISRNFAKGRMILIDGEIQTRQYTDKSGNTVYATEINAERACFTGERLTEQGQNVAQKAAPAPPAPRTTATPTAQHPTVQRPSAPTVPTPEYDDDFPF